jgi:hypothetical protein
MLPYIHSVNLSDSSTAFSTYAKSNGPGSILLLALVDSHVSREVGVV